MSTFYLKYRPQTISELDLTSVRESLAQVLQSKGMPHAFLFSGRRGLGKTSAARILAKAINCESRIKNPRGSTRDKQESSIKKDVYLKKQAKKNQRSGASDQVPYIEPCNVCGACVSITKGSSADFIEIDGASNRGIDDIRQLRESVMSAPSSMRKKVYVIDEVHMLTREAFNALLKTLEEPPDHVIFVLATTEVNKVPETIVSRTFTVAFHQATSLELKRALQRVVSGEKLTVAEGVLDKIVLAADGGFRDAHKILEQLAFAGTTIDETAYAQIFPQVQIDELIVGLQKGSTHTVFEWIDEAQVQGVDWEGVFRSMLTRLKDHLLSFYLDHGSLYDLSEPETRRLIGLVLTHARELVYALVPTLPMQLVAAEWLESHKQANTKTQKQERNRSDYKDKAENRKQKVESRSEKTDDRELKSEGRKSKAGDGNTHVSKSKKKENNDKIENPSRARTPSKKVGFTLGELTQKWDEFIKVVQPYNHSVAALLRSAKPVKVEDTIVEMKVFYEFHKGKLESPKCRGIVEQAFEEFFGDIPKIVYILGDRSERSKVIKKKDDDFAKMAEEIFS